MLVRSIGILLFWICYFFNHEAQNRPEMKPCMDLSYCVAGDICGFQWECYWYSYLVPTDAHYFPDDIKTMISHLFSLVNSWVLLLESLQIGRKPRTYEL